jgi:DNA invertase Pin-like site-specific DNA recombinase
MQAGTHFWLPFLLLLCFLCLPVLVLAHEMQARIRLERRMKFVSGAAIYLNRRVGLATIARQRDDMRAFASSRGWHVCLESDDDFPCSGSSGTGKPRPGLDAILSRGADVQILLLPSLSTLSPERCEAYVLGCMLFENGIGLCVPGSRLDCSTEAGMREVRSRLSEYASDLAIYLPCH